jgi:hypothetical protein
MTSLRQRMIEDALLVVLLTFCGTLPAGQYAADPSTYYVDGRKGNDGWSGLRAAPNRSKTDGPFQTLTRAQLAMQGGSIKTTTVRKGTYSIGSAFNFTSSDNGESWVPFIHERAVIDGGGSGGGYFSATGVSNFTFEGFTLQNMGCTSGHCGTFLIQGTSSNVTLRWLTFRACLGYCIQAGNVQSSLFDSNTFKGQTPGTNPANGLPYKVLDFGSGSSNNTVSHNLIENAEGGGIDFERGPTDPPQQNNVIDRNILENVNTNDHDMGAIYAYDPNNQSTGLQITNNLVFGNLGTDPTTDLIRAFFLDQAVSGAVVTGNICNECGEWAIQYLDGANNIVTNNIFDLSSDTMLGFYQLQGITQCPSRSPCVTNMAGNTFTNNIVYSNSEFPETFWNEYGSPPTPLADTTNLYYLESGGEIPNGQPIVDANPQYGNPEFTDPGNNDYTISPSSPAYSLINWQTLPTDQGPLANPFH